MKQIFKRILKILLLTLFIIGSIVFVITTYFADDIEKSVIRKIQQSLRAPLILDDVEFTIYENFPAASVKITNLLVMESKKFNNDTLLFTKRAYVEISLLDIINKKYNLQNIIITDAKINVKYNNLNNPNFLIFKKNTDNKNPISIKKITLLKTQLNIKKETPIVNMSWDLNRAIISINNMDYTFNVTGFSNKLVVGTTDYMNTKTFDFIANTQITKDTIEILKSDLNIEDILFNITGVILKGRILDLEIDGKKQKINQIITHLPENIQKVCSQFIANGEITFHSSLKGLINKENNPLFEMNYEIIKGDFNLKSVPFKLHNVRINGDLNNGKDRNFNSTKITANLFKAQTKGGSINGEFILKNLNNYFLNSQFTSSWDLAEVNQYFKDSPFIGLRGTLLTNTSYKGNIAFDIRFKNMFLNARHKSDVTVKNIKFNYKLFPLKFSFKSIDCKLDKHKILINSCQSTISETDINFKGEILNLIPYILGGAPKIYVDGNIRSTYTNFSEFMTLGSISDDNKKGEEKTIMPNWIDANTIIDVKNFSYENFIASDLGGVISYTKGAINGKNLNALSLNGEIAGEFTLSEPIRKNLKLVSNIALKKINIRNSFDAFNSYGQTFIVKEQLKGMGSAEINIESYWGPNFVLDKKNLKVKSHLIIEKGELIDFKPLESLSSYVSLEELKNVKFSTLENTIDVANEIVTIPTMEIKSSALSVVLSGTQTFNQEINYEITLLLSELLSTSFRKKNTQITEFGEKQENGKIFNTVYFKMTGNTDNPKISLNKIRFMDDVNKSVKKERAIISNILKADILQKEKKDNEEKGQEIDIEWNPEF
jgi:hypothetical protein